jgi:hypothetical protein
MAMLLAGGGRTVVSWDTAAAQGAAAERVVAEKFVAERFAAEKFVAERFAAERPPVRRLAARAGRNTAAGQGGPKSPARRDGGLDTRVPFL